VAHYRVQAVQLREMAEHGADAKSCADLLDLADKYDELANSYRDKALHPGPRRRRRPLERWKLVAGERWPAHRHPVEVDKPVDRSQQMPPRHVPFKRELVKRRILSDATFPIIDFTCD
jgi:hypothetical protein